MAQEVELPDGSIAEFPDGMPTGDIEKALQQHFADSKPAEAPKETGTSLTDYAKDVAKSAVYRGIPEGLASVTPLGFSANIIRGVSDLTRWGAHKAIDAVTGEKLPYANENPVPTSHDILQAALKPKGLNGSGIDLYEPKTTPGQYANTVAQFASGGLATGVPLAQSIPAAVASEAAGQAAQGSEYEPAVRIAGALAGGYLGGRVSDKITQPKPAPITADSIKQIANQKYAEVENLGVQLPKEVTNKYIDGVKSTLLSKDDLINSMKSSQPLRDAFDDIALFKDQPMTLSRAQALDEQIGNMVDSHTTLGQVNKVGKKLLDAQSQLRKTIDDNFDTPALKEARQAWAAQAKLRDIERIMTRAETMENPATGIKTGFRQLLTNPNKSKWYSPAELKIIEQGAKTGIAGDILKTLGSRLIPIMAAGSGGGLTGTAIATAGSMASRNMATKAQVNRAMKLSDAVTKPYKSAPLPSSNALLIQQILNKQINMPGLLSNGYVGTNNPTGLLAPRP